MLSSLLSITWDVNPEITNILGREIRWYGLCWALGLLAAYLIVEKIYKHEKISDKWFSALFWYVVLGVIIGARLVHCFFYGADGDPFYYFKNPIEILKIWEGGLASHGGALGIVVGVFLYHRKTKQSILWVLDRIMVPTGLTAAFIRLGNLMNSEIFGKPTDLPWGFNFIRSQEWIALGGVPCHPTQIYEALVYLAVFGIAMYLYWKTDAKEKQGLILGIGLIIIFTARILLEYLKNVQVQFEIDMRAAIGMDMGQLLSLPFVIWGIWLVWNALKKKPTKELIKDKK